MKLSNPVWLRKIKKIADNLLFYYEFEDNVNDLSAKDKDGTITGTNTSFNPSGIQGKRLDFATGTSYVKIPNDTLNQLTNNIAINCWIWTGSTLYSGPILGQQNEAVADVNDPADYVPVIYIDDSFKIRAKLWTVGGTPASTLVFNTPISTNSVYHIVVSSDSTGMEQYLYVNGINVSTLNESPYPIGFLTMSFNQIGAGYYGNQANWAGITTVNTWRYFTGSVDQAFLMKKEFKQEDVTWLYNSGNGRTPSEILSY